MLRSDRARIVREMSARGASSRVIGKRLGVAPSTVRDLRRDADRAKQRARQTLFRRRRRAARLHLARPLPMTGVAIAGKPVVSMRPSGWKRGGPHRGRTEYDAAVRGVQERAIVGYYARRGGG